MRKKILIVDDDQAVLDYLQAKLGVRYDLVSTAAADAVMRLVHKEMPDLILCDIDMPEVDGGDVSAQLYGDDRTRYIPLLFLSALVPASDAKRGEVGGRPAISKSAPIDQLIARIESLMG
jgi:two-component system cell cycle response regulator